MTITSISATHDTLAGASLGAASAVSAALSSLSGFNLIINAQGIPAGNPIDIFIEYGNNSGADVSNVQIDIIDSDGLTILTPLPLNVGALPNSLAGTVTVPVSVQSGGAAPVHDLSLRMTGEQGGVTYVDEAVLPVGVIFVAANG